MPRRSGPVHVATTRRSYKGKTYTTHLLRRTYRENGKVRNETVGNLSHLPDSVVELVRQSLRGKVFVSAEDGGVQICRTWPHGHVAAVLGTARKLELGRLLGSRPSPERDRIMGLVVARILDPASKLATARMLSSVTGSTSLGESLGLGEVTADDLYAALDWLAKRQPWIEKKLAERHLQDGSLLLYDITSAYFEGRTCPLAALGKSRDGRRGKLQITIGLLCTADGCPVAVEVFPGNTGDPATLGAAIRKARQRFGLRKVVIVGDRGLLTDKRIEEELRPQEGLDWITALRSPAIAGLVKDEALQLTLFDQQDLFEFTSPDYPDERLIACRNPFLAEERARKRESLLCSTERELEKIAVATRRSGRPLRGKDAIGVRVGKVLGRYKVGKHFIYEITEDAFTYRRNTQRIADEASLDGIYVIRSSVSRESRGSVETVQAYKDLSRIEQAFRSLKTVDLEMRPIRHWRPDRVRAHVFLCMLAYYVLWHMRRALAPMLFQDDDPERGRERRASVVGRAQRSESAAFKAATGLTPEGEPVHDFHSLLADLATLAKNRCCVRGLGEATFDQYTDPTPLQSRAYDLLGVSHRL